MSQKWAARLPPCKFLVGSKKEEICNIGKMYLSHQTPAPPPRPLPFDRNCGGGGVMTEHFVVVGQFDFVFIKIFISQENKLTISDFQMYTEHREL